MRMTPQPMPPTMLRNGSMFPRPRDDVDGGARASPVAPRSPAAAPAFEDGGGGESNVDCFSGKVAAPPRRGFNSPSTVCSAGGEQNPIQRIVVTFIQIR